MQTDYKKNLDELVDFGLSENSCVLFIGPELMKFDGKNCNSAFYETLPDEAGENVDKQKAKYNAKEKIWNFTSRQIQREFYFQYAKFYKKNRNLNNPVFHKLASIPFHLIVSLIPDDTLSAAFSQYENFKFDFKSFLLDNEVDEPTKENMLIYNIYGNIRNKEYVASHFDYLNFILEYAKNGFPRNFVSAIKKANYLVFVGFEFDKWYNILLLYILNLIKSETEKYAVEEQSVEELYKKLSDSSLNMLFVDKNNEIFITDLYQKAKEYNILRDIVPKKEYLMNMIKSNQETIIKINKRLQVTSDPMEQKRFKLDIEYLEKDNEDLQKQLKNLQL